IGEEKECKGKFDLLDNVNIPIVAFDEYFHIDITEYVNNQCAARACSATSKCVRGLLSYEDPSQKSGNLNFQGVVRPKPLASREGPWRLGSASPPSEIYDVLLPSPAVNAEVRRSIAQKVGPNEVDHFLMFLEAKRSASYNLVMEVRDSAASTI